MDTDFVDSGNHGGSAAWLMLLQEPGGGPMVTGYFGRFAAAPVRSQSRDAMLLITLAPGSYPAQISGVDNTTGVAAVEVYEMP